MVAIPVKSFETEQMLNRVSPVTGAFVSRS